MQSISMAKIASFFQRFAIRRFFLSAYRLEMRIFAAQNG